MKTAKKALLLVLCGCLLVAASIIGTMAYFTDQEAVTNTFTIGKVGISLDEAVVDEYGKATGGRTQDGKTEGNEYKIIPGHTYEKDPMVTVDADSEPSYIRMFVKVNNYANLKIWDDPKTQDVVETIEVFPDSYFDATTGVFLLQNLCVDKEGNNTWDSAIWKFANFDENTNTYEFRYYQTVSTVDKNAQELKPLFTHFTIPGDVVTMENIGAFEGISLEITAQAIQADGFAADTAVYVESEAETAWGEF